MPTRFVEVLRTFLRFIGDDPIEDTTDLRVHGLDSMKAIELLFAIEDAFGITLADDAMNDATFRTAGSLWQAVERSGRDESLARAL